jgi:CheY-like chemotaxis protein
MRVLVADDDRVISHLLCAVLREAGHQPVPAFDAMQTMMFAMRAPQPDVILLDINMPGGTGVEALRKLKASAKTMLIPVVVLSGSLDPAMPGVMLELGADEFLSKPPQLPEVIAALERVAGGGIPTLR